MLSLMLSFLVKLGQNIWLLTAQMAPYLLFGFLFAGVLHVLVRRELIERWLGRPGIMSVVKASVLGVPMPLCSCSVIPVAAALRKSGASKGATASFLSSTPQTGVDSILATYALLGGLFAGVRVVVALLCGVITGFLIELISGTKGSAESRGKKDESASLQSLKVSLNSPDDCSMEPIKTSTQAGTSCCGSQSVLRRSIPNAVRAAVNYGSVTLPADLANALIVGLILAGFITTVMPADLITGPLSGGALAFLLATVVSIPLYVCATASIPMAYALIAAGLSPGAALVFLITGPATNTATIATVWKLLGRAATSIYLLCLLSISWVAGWLLNSTLSVHNIGEHTHHHHEGSNVHVWQHLSGGFLIALLAWAVWHKYRKSCSEQGSCCSS